ncbi:MAG: glycosyltransferase family 4 protein, partial [Mycoplasmataceae bacterium]|nr:glycosyltransferase family 4 protein [Mycoplasmataceae bacterium]
MENYNICFLAYLDNESGLSEAARLNLETLRDSGLSVFVKNFSRDNKLLTNAQTEEKIEINIVHININFIRDFISLNKQELDKAKYNIAYWAWEFEVVPEDFLEYTYYFDEIWVPSHFCVEAFAAKISIPVLKFSHPVSLTSKMFKKIHFNIPEQGFVFLTIFDSLSSLERKNPFATIDAFLKKFKGNDSVYLVVKTNKLEKFKKEYLKMKSLVSLNKNIILINRYLSKNELHSLIQVSNAYISLHRSEGFGLTMAEAMGYGIPVIATGYSGNMDFMNVNNSLLVKYSMTKTQFIHGITPVGSLFADPDIDHAAEQMRNLYIDSQLRAELSMSGSDYILKKHGIDIIGLKMKCRLDFIFKNKLTGDRTDSEINELYLQQKYHN